MIDSSPKRRVPLLDNDGDATDIEINRKLTEHLRKHAMNVTAGQTPARLEASTMMPTAPSQISAIRFFGRAVAQTVGLVAIIALTALASIHAFLYEKES